MQMSTTNLKNDLATPSRGEEVKWSCSVVSDPLWPHGLQPIRLLCPWDFPGKNTGVGCHFLLQGSSPPRDRTQVSRIVGRTQVSRIVGRCFYQLSHQGSQVKVSTKVLPFSGRKPRTSLAGVYREICKKMFIAACFVVE